MTQRTLAKIPSLFLKDSFGFAVGSLGFIVFTFSVVLLRLEVAMPNVPVPMLVACDRGLEGDGATGLKLRSLVVQPRAKCRDTADNLGPWQRDLQLIACSQ